MSKLRRSPFSVKIALMAATLSGRIAEHRAFGQYTGKVHRSCCGQDAQVIALHIELRAQCSAAYRTAGNNRGTPIDSTFNQKTAGDTSKGSDMATVEAPVQLHFAEDLTQHYNVALQRTIDEESAQGLRQDLAGGQKQSSKSP